MLRVLCIAILLLSSAATAPARDVMEFDQNWLFTLGDPEGAEQPKFEDAAWRLLEIPHDWAFEANYAKDAAQEDRGGYKPGGVGWYRKTFKLPAGWDGRRIAIHFDGVYMNSEVWINGHRLGNRPYGYIPFHYDLTPFLQLGENTIAVRVDNSREPSARWYHGCGIYSHVRLIATDPVHVVRDGVFITTPVISAEEALVEVDIEIHNASKESERVLVETSIIDPNGKVVASAEGQTTVAEGGDATLDLSTSVADPMRWGIDTPHRYTLRAELKIDDETVDSLDIRFGIREIRWEAETGFWLNGNNIKLKGVADHLEAGPVGAASPDELIRWKIQLLKSMGCNAIRCAHNPQVRTFYEICDEMGMLVMDEIFDGWKRKAAEDYGHQAFADWWERDLRVWLRAHRNHPSIIVWSLGNETGGDVGAELVRICHELDPTRLTTSGHSGPEFMDIEGVNGSSEKMTFWKKLLASSREKPFVSTEAPHTWQVRGFYRSKTWWRDGYPNKRQAPYPCPDLTDEEVFTYDWISPSGRANRKQVFNSSYDNAMVRITARRNWQLVRDTPWYAGHFRWTGFDYLGEAGYVHGGWPFRAFMGGALDLAGFKKDLFYFYQSQWTDDPMVHILPHWTHPRMEAGRKIPVWVYSNCDEVELLLNGQSLGSDHPGTEWNEMQCEWFVPWSPGGLEAIGYRDGREVTRCVVRTAGAPARLELSVEGRESPIVTVKQTDQSGVLNPYAESRVHYHVDGPARILSLESGNPVNTENNFGRSSRAAFFGLARCFLEASPESGDISIVAAAILGQKRLVPSRVVSIDVQSLAVLGEAKRRDLRALYSVDGSEPDVPYTGPFEIVPDTTVRAAVYDDQKLLMKMSERFGPGEGIYWGDRETMVNVEAAAGEQAEDARFVGARVSKQGEGFQGAGYLDFGHNKGAFVEWYQENDGSAGDYTLSIRYSGNPKGRKGRTMQLTVNGRSQELFFKSTQAYGSDWKELQVPIRLKSGANTIRITTIENGGMVLDSIQLK